MIINTIECVKPVSSEAVAEEVTPACQERSMNPENKLQKSTRVTYDRMKKDARRSPELIMRQFCRQCHLIKSTSIIEAQISAIINNKHK